MLDDLGNAGLSAFLVARPRLFGIAYRMLGSVNDAEDVVQETWIRWSRTDHDVVRDAVPFLVTIATRVSLSVAQSARARHESYVGPWIPEPIDTSADPMLGAESDEALELAVLMLLDRLRPVERAAFLLRKAFDYPYAQIAEILSISEASARKHVSRSGAHLAGERRRQVADSEQKRLLETFAVAARTGNLAALESLLTTDVVSYSDGGGAVHAARKPIVGRDNVSNFLCRIADRVWSDATQKVVRANGKAAILLSRDCDAVCLLSTDCSDDGIEQILFVLNPDKLQRFNHAQ